MPSGKIDGIESYARPWTWGSGRASPPCLPAQQQWSRKRKPAIIQTFKWWLAINCNKQACHRHNWKPPVLNHWITELERKQRCGGQGIMYNYIDYLYITHITSIHVYYCILPKRDPKAPNTTWPNAGRKNHKMPQALALPLKVQSSSQKMSVSIANRCSARPMTSSARSYHGNLDHHETLHLA